MKLTSLQKLGVAAGLILVASACTPDPPPLPDVPQIWMDPSYPSGFFSLPWPNDSRLTKRGTVDVAGFPGTAVDPADILTGALPPGAALLPSALRSLGQISDGFGVNSAIFFRSQTPLDDATLPSVEETVGGSGSVALMDLESGVLAPVIVETRSRGNRYRPPNSLIVLPYPGHPLRPETRYAAVVFKSVHATSGNPLEASTLIGELDQPWSAATGTSEEKWTALRAQRDEVQSAVDSHTSMPSADIAAFTVFTTQDPHREMNAVASAIANYPTPSVDEMNVGPCLGDNAGRSLVNGSINMPHFQSGDYPYVFDGGSIVREDGLAVVQGTAAVPIEISVPCAAPPTTGWPAVAFIDGTGSAGKIRDFGAPFTYDGRIVAQIPPLYGAFDQSALPVAQQIEVEALRSATGINDVRGSLFYNAINPAAARSHLIQQAANHLVMIKVLRDLDLPGSPLGQSQPVSVDPSRVSAAGHSQGAETLPMTAANDADLLAVVSSSGAGAFYHLFSHTYQRDLLSQLTGEIEHLTELSPLLHLMQTGLEAADPANFTSDAHYLAIGGRLDEQVAFESVRHLAQSTGLVSVGVADPESVYGSPPFDPDTASLPVTANASGKTRVAYETPYGHFPATMTPEVGGAFLREAEAGLAPTVHESAFDSESDPSWYCCRSNTPRTFGEGER